MKRFTQTLTTVVFVLFTLTSHQIYGQGIAGADKTECGSPATLNADPGATPGKWTTPSSAYIVDDTKRDTEVYNLEEGANKFIWTHNGTSDEMVVYNDSIGAEAGPDQDTCSTTQLAANNPSPGTGTWTNISGTATFVDPNAANTEVTHLGDLAAGNELKWTIVNGSTNCTTSDNVLVTNTTPDANAGADATICGPSYTLGANSPDASETGKWTLTDGVGAFGDITSSTTDITGLSGTDPSTLEWTVTSAEGCETSDKVTITYDSTAADAGDDQTVCSPTTTLNATEPQTGSGTWSTTGTATINNPGQNNSGVEGLVAGVNTFIWSTETPDCPAEHDTVRITRIKAEAGGDQIVCASEDATLTAKTTPDIGSGEWSLESGSGSAVSPSSDTTKVTGLGRTDNVFSWSVSHPECASDAYDEVTKTNDSISVTASSSANTVCDATATLELTGSDPGGSGSWSTSSGANIDSPNNPTTDVTDFSLGKNSFKWEYTSAEGCTDSDTTVIMNNEVTDAVADANTTVVCSSSDLEMNGSQPGPTESGEWTFNSGNADFVEPSAYDTKVNNLGADNNEFEWTISNGGCSKSDLISIRNDSVSAVNAGADATICDTDYDLNASSLNGTETGQWSSPASYTYTDDTDPGATVSDLDKNAVNTLTWTVTKGTCSESDDVKITSAQPDNPVNAGSNQTVCDGTATLNATLPAGYSGQWSSAGSETFSDNTSATSEIGNLPYGDNGDNEVTLTWEISKGSCDFSDQVTITNNKVFADAGADQTVCTDQAALNAEDPADDNDTPDAAEGTWSLSGATFSDVNNPDATVSGLNRDNQLEWKVTLDGCTAKDYVNIANREVTDAIANQGGGDMRVCAADTSLNALSANSTIGETGSWTNPDGSGNIIDNDAPDTKVTDLGYGENVFRWTISSADGNCSKSDDVHVYNDLPYDVSAGANQTICQDTTHLAATQLTRGTGEWSQDGTNDANFADDTRFNTPVSNLTETDGNKDKNTFIWTASYNGCSVKDTVEIIAMGYNMEHSDYAAQAPADTSLCADTFDLATVSPAKTGDEGEWSVIQGNATFDDNTAFSTTARNLQRDSNTLRWTTTVTSNPVECTFNSDVVLINDLPSEPNAMENTTVCDERISLNAIDPTVGNGTWHASSAGVTFSDSTYQNSDVGNLNAGINDVYWQTTNNGCELKDYVQIDYSTVDADIGTDSISTCKASYKFIGQPSDPSPATGAWDELTGTVSVVDSTVHDAKVTNISDDGNLNELVWIVTNGDGCTASDTVGLRNHSVETYAFPQDTVICQDSMELIAKSPEYGQDGLWNVYSGSGDFAFPDSNETYVRNLDDDNTFRWVVEDTTYNCKDTAEVKLNNQAVYAEPEAAETVTCESDVELYPTPALNSGETGLWTSTTATFDDADSAKTRAYNLNSGNNVLEWKVSNGSCADSSEITVNYNEVIANIAGDDTIHACGNSSHLTAQFPPKSGQWTTVDNSAHIVNDTWYSTDVTDLKFDTKTQDGINTFRWKITDNDCKDSVEVVVKNDKNTEFDAGNDQVVCENNSVTMDAYDPAPDGGSGEWFTTGEGGGVFDDKTAHNTRITSLQPDTNKFRWVVDEESCTGIQDYVDIINNTPTTADAGSDSIVCTSTINLYGNVPNAEKGNGRWEYSGANTGAAKPTIVTPTKHNTKVTGLTPEKDGGDNKFTWKITKGSCESSDEVDISYIELSASVGTPKDTSICDRELPLYAKEPRSSIDSQKWIVENTPSSATFTSTTKSKATVSNLKDNNTLIWKITQDGCKDRDTLQISSNSFDASAENDFSVCSASPSKTLDGTLPAGWSGEWDTTHTGSGTIHSPSNATTDVSGLEPGDNIFTWKVTNLAGCTDTDSVTVLNKKYEPITASADETTVCKTTVEVDGNDPEPAWSGEWVSPTASFDTPSDRHNTAENLDNDPNELSWKVTRDGCADSATVTVINNKFTASASNQTVCKSSATLEGKAVVASTSETITTTEVNWEWSHGTVESATFTSPTTQYNPSVEDLDSKLNQFKWTAHRSGCSNSGGVDIYNAEVKAGGILVSGANNDSTGKFVCSEDETITLYTDSLDSNESGKWKVKNGGATIIDKSSATTDVHGLKKNADNVFLWTLESDRGCRDSVYKTVENREFTVNAVSNDTICNDNIATIGGTDPGVGTGTWTADTDVTFDNADSANTTVRGLEPGENVLTWEIIRNGCTHSDQKVIYNNEFPADANTGTPIAPLCDTNSTPLEANNPPSPWEGTWSTSGSSATFDDTQNNTTTVHDLEPGDNTLVWTITHNDDCPNRDTIDVTNNRFFAGGDDKTVCSASTVVSASAELIDGTDVTSEGNWDWSAASGTITSSSDTSTINVAGLSSGNNSFDWEVTRNGCTKTGDIKVLSRQLDAAIVNPPGDKTICKSSEVVNLSGAPEVDADISGKWTASDPAAMFTNTTNHNTSVSGLSGTSTITWEVIDNHNCSDTANVTIINNNFYVSAGSDTTICGAGEISSLNGYKPSSASGQWYGDATFVDDTVGTTDITDIDHGSTTLTWEATQNGCTLSDDVVITNNKFEASAGLDNPSDTMVCDNDVTLDGNSPPADWSGQWSSDGSPTYSNDTQHNTNVVLGDTSTTFTWTITSNNDATCETSDEVQVANHAYTVTAENNTVCESEATLVAEAVDREGNDITDAVSWNWDSSASAGSGTIADTTSATTLASGLGSGDNTFGWRANYQDCPTKSGQVTITDRSLTAKLDMSDETICDASETVTLAAQEPASGVDSKWKVAGGSGDIAASSVNYHESAVKNLGNNDNTIRWKIERTDGSGCEDSIDVTITNNTLDIELGANADKTVCDDPPQLVGDEPDDPGSWKGEWKTDGNAYFADSIAKETEAYNLDAGENKFTWHVEQAGCDGEDSLFVTNDTYEADADALTTAACTETVTLDANSPDSGWTGEWYSSTGSPTFQPDANDPGTVAELSQVDNTLIWKITKDDAASCTSRDSVFITNNYLDITAKDDTVCTTTHTIESEALNIKGHDSTSNANWTWDHDYGPGAIVSTSGAKVTLEDLSQAETKLAWEADFNGCTFKDSVSVVSHKTKAQVSYNDTTVCDEPVTLQAIDPKFGTGYWDAPGSATVANTTNNVTDAGNLNSGDNTFRWIVEKGSCDSIENVNVTNNGFDMTAGSDTVVCPSDEVITLNGTPVVTGTGAWTIAGGSNADFANSTDANTQVTNFDPGANTFIWTITRDGCTESDDVTLYSNTDTAGIKNVPAAVCTETLTAQAHETASTDWNGEWSSSTATFDDNQSATPLVDLEDTSNTLTWTVTRQNADSCSSSDDATVKSNYLDFTVEGETVCSRTHTIEAKAIDIAGNDRTDDVTWSWDQIFGTGKIVSSSNGQVTVEDLGHNDTRLKWKAEFNGCRDSGTIDLMSRYVIADAQKNDTVCNTTPELTASSPVYGTGEWSSLGSATVANKTAATTMVGQLDRGSSYTFKWKVTDPAVRCSTSTFVEILNKKASVAEITTNDTLSCCSDRDTLKADVPLHGTGHWEKNSALTVIKDSASNETEVTKLAKGYNSFYWIVENGKKCSDTDTVWVNNKNVTADAGLGGNVCGDTVGLNANEPTGSQIGEWTCETNVVTFDDETSDSTTVRGLRRGENRFKWEVTDTLSSCAASNKVTVYRNEPSEAQVGNDTIETCADSTKLTATEPTYGTGEWRIIDAPDGIKYPDSASTSVINMRAGENTYKWEVTKNGCNSEAEVVVVNNAVNVETARDDTVCRESLTLNANVDPTDYDSLRWFGTNVQYPDSAQTEVTDLPYGKNTFRVEAYRGACSGDNERVITGRRHDVTASANESVVCDAEGNISANPLGFEGQWSKANPGSAEIVSPSYNNTQVTQLKQGSNTFRWTIKEDMNPGVCESTDEVTIQNNEVNVDIKEEKTVCTSSPVIETSIPVEGEGEWTSPDNDIYFADSTSSKTTVYDLQSGANQIIWALEKNGCVGKDTMIVYNNKHSIIAEDKDVCGSEAELRASAAPDGADSYWQTSGETSADITNPDTNSTQVTDLSTGKNTFTWVVKHEGCTATDDAVITNYKYEDKVSAGNDQDLCGPNTTMQNVKLPDASSGEWKLEVGNGTINNPTYKYTSVSNLGQDTNTFTWNVTTHTSAPECIVRDTVRLINNEIQSTVGNDTTVCKDSVQLQAGDPGDNTGTWEKLGGFSDIVDKHSPNTWVKNLSSDLNTFEWTVKGNGCEKVSRIDVTNNSFAISAGEDRVLSTGASTTLNPPDNLIPAGYTSQKWELLGGDATFPPGEENELNAEVNNLTTGVNKFELTIVDNGCEAKDTVNIKVKDFNAYTRPDTATCQDSVKLDANDPVPGATGKWSLIQGSGDFADKTKPDTWVTGLRKSTANKFKWTVTKNGVSVSDVVVIQNNAFELQPHDTIDGCKQTAMLDAEPAGTNGTGNWSVYNGSSGTFAHPDSANTRVNDLSKGLNEFIWNVERNNCTNKDTVQVIYYPPPDAGFASNKTEVCSGDTVTFLNTSDTTYASDTMTYDWEFGDGLISEKKDTSHEYSYINTEPGSDTTYTVEMIATSEQSGYGCPDTARQDITVYPKPKAGFTPDTNKLIHPDTDLPLNNESKPGYESYIWDFDNGETVKQDSFYNEFTYVYDSTEFIADTFDIQMKVNNAHCFDTTSERIVIIPSSPVAEIDTFVQGCAPLTVSFNNHSLYAEDYKWEFGNGSNSTEKYPTYTYYEPGEYVVSLKAFGEGGTDYVKQDTVLVHELPVAYLEAKPDSVMLPNQPVHTYSLSEGADEYLWKFGDGDTSSQESPVHYYEESGYQDIKLKVWSEHGCVDSIEVPNAVYVEEGGKIKFPNAFTPNLNGPVGGHYSEGQYNNDVFFPLHRGIETYTLKIYTRWGELIFESDDPDIGWDGYYNGKLMPQSTYIWKVEGTFTNGEPFSKTGSVTLIR